MATTGPSHGMEAASVSKKQRGRRTGRPPRIESQHYLQVAAAVEVLRWDFYPLLAKGSKRYVGAAQVVSEKLKGLIKPERVAQLYKRHRRQLPTENYLDVYRLSFELYDRYSPKEPEIPDPALDPKWLARQTRESLETWFRAKYAPQRWRNPRQKRAAWAALQAELKKR